MVVPHGAGELLIVHFRVVLGEPPHPAELGLVDDPEDAGLLVLPPHHARIVVRAPQYFEQPGGDSIRLRRDRKGPQKGTEDRTEKGTEQI